MESAYLKCSSNGLQIYTVNLERISLSHFIVSHQIYILPPPSSDARLAPMPSERVIFINRSIERYINRRNELLRKGHKRSRSVSPSALLHLQKLKGEPGKCTYSLLMTAALNLSVALFSSFKLMSTTGLTMSNLSNFGFAATS